MHNSSLLRMQWFVENFANTIEKDNLSVLDVGSYDVNGSYKQFFEKPRYAYTGLDMESGPNVDIVLETPYNWQSINDDTFDIVISGQAFEHIEFFWITLDEMTRVLKKDGLLCIIVPNGFGEHRYPVDCYRFFTDGMISMGRYVSLDILHAHTNAAPSYTSHEWYSEFCADSMLVARKPYAGNAVHPDFKGYKCIPSDLDKTRGKLKPFNKTYEQTQEELLNLRKRVFDLECKYDNLKKSNSWRLTSPLRIISTRIRHITRLLS
jgi:SAM-dependent methyltransferase